MMKRKIIKINIFLIGILLAISNIYIINVSSDPIKTIYGSVTSCGNTNFQGAIVIVSAEGFNNEQTTINNQNVWQVDVGSETGTEWPENTIFNINVTFESWTGSSKGSIKGTYTDVGEITMIPNNFTINANIEKNNIITFTDFNLNSTVTGGDPPYNFTWYINNEKILYNQNVTYQFKESGYYNIELAVRDSCGNEIRDNFTINVGINPNSNKNNTPGFELFLIICSINLILLYLIFNRKK